MISSKFAKITVSLAACVCLGACSTSQNGQPSPESSFETPFPSNSPVEDSSSATSGENTPQVPPGENRGTGTTVADPSPRGGCDSTAHNPLSEVNSVPIISSGGQDFSFSITEDHFDPCAPLSWSILAGGVGTGNSQRQGVVFFREGRPVADPAPLMEEKVNAVTPLDTDSVKVSYEVLDGPRAAGQSLPGSVVFALTPEGDLAISENTLPAVADEAGIQLDVRNL